MVTDTQGYIEIIVYLTENLHLFELTTDNKQKKSSSTDTVIAIIEVELSDQIISVCSQNKNLTFNQRNEIIREVDAIAYDLEEVFSAVVNNQASTKQKEFIKEFSGLIKNLFDDVIHNA